jgi:6,7-dimethyl-8-ribityllumazine synthase
VKMPEGTSSLDGTGLKVGVAVSEFNAFVTEGLLRGALEALQQFGVADPTVVRVPGAFELPVVAKALADAGHDCVVALGAVIRGETDHYTLVANECAAGLQRVAVVTGVPIGFGVLASDHAEQAKERSLPGAGNKGAEAAEAAVLAALAVRAIRTAVIGE